MVDPFPTSPPAPDAPPHGDEERLLWLHWDWPGDESGEGRLGVRLGEGVRVEGGWLYAGLKTHTHKRQCAHSPSHNETTINNYKIQL